MFPRLSAIKKLMLTKRSYMYTSGWMEGLKRGYPCRPDGEPIPWMNYPVIKFLEDRLKPDQTMFEFGSGYSTLFYTKRIKSVTSVENNHEWLEHLKDTLPDNSTVIYQELELDGYYCRTIETLSQHFDIIVIDGFDRVNCMRHSLPWVTDRGVIILDDSQREKYIPAFEMARAGDFRELSFEGIKPGKHEFDCTTIFYRAGNCFGI